jgi:antirestriction protein ArdC
MSTDKHKPPADWAALLVDAVTKPGVISDAYSRFWSYSVGNQLLALFQCHARGIEPGPIHTFSGWKDLGRSVRKGERGLTLCMPVTCRTTKASERAENAATGGDGAERPPEVRAFTRFVYRANWFVLSQTEGKEYVPASLRDWEEERALESLMIVRVPFRHADGNTQGYARERQVAVSPLAFLPHRTLFHEVAHVVLGHTLELQGLADGQEATARDIREVEAECVALICCESLDLNGSEFSRGYIQHWLRKETIAQTSAQKIFRAADEILRAGRPTHDDSMPSTAAG